MTITWFRCYHEIIDDPKIGMMSDTDQLLWFKLLCLASSDRKRGYVTLTDEEIAFKLRCSAETWQHAKDKYRAKGLIEHRENAIAIVGWDIAQHPENPYGRLPAAEWRKIRVEVFVRDNYTCKYCGVQSSKMHCDHITPISRGGTNEMDNLATACPSCNLSKHNKTLEEWELGE